MTKRSEVKLKPASGKPDSLNVALELADTTWRMTVPVVLLAGLGLVADKKLGSLPWLTLLGMAAGFYVAARLVKQQLKRGARPEPKV